jgi:hypothetical protein
MILTTLALGGAILGATTIAGLLLLYQIRATTDSESSAKAIFAADAGVEWTLFDFYCAEATGPIPRCTPPLPASLSLTLGNGALAQATCYDALGATTDCSNTSTAVDAVTKGTSLNAERAFFLELTTATATVP